MVVRIFIPLFIVLPAVSHAEVVRSITVAGVCQRKVAPDRGRVTVTVSVVKPNAQSASKQAMSDYETLRKDLKRMKLADEELETSEYTVQEESDWVNNKKINKGYRVRMGLQVSTSDIQRLGDVLAVASKLNIGEVGGLETYLSSELNRQSKEKCLEEALMSARSKAEKMAKAVKASLGEVLTIDESPKADRQPIMMDTMKEMASAKVALAPGIETKPEEVAVSISVTWGLKQ